MPDGAEVVVYELPGWAVAVRSPHPELFGYLDAFYDRGTSRPPDGQVEVFLSTVERIEPYVSMDPACPRTGQVLCRCRADTFPPEFTFQEARLLIRDLWTQHLLLNHAAFNLHGAAVDDGERVVVLIGPRYAGKTTLMLHMLAEYGFSLISNDNLVVYDDDGQPRLTGVPTYCKVRLAPATRFREFLGMRARHHGHDAAMWQRFLRDPSQYPFHGEAMLSMSGFAARRQPCVPLHSRRLILVDVGFTDGPPVVTESALPPVAVAAWLRSRLKWFAAPAGDADRHLDAFAAAAQVWRYRHRGDADPLVAVLATAVSRLEGVGS